MKKKHLKHTYLDGITINKKTLFPGGPIFMKKKILFPGGSGFIGSHIVEKLIELDYSVTVVDLWEYETFKTISSTKLKFLEMDVNQLHNELKILEEHDHMIYFSSILGTSETITTYKHKIDEVITTNTLTPVKLMNVFCKSGKKMIIPITPKVDWLNPYKITKYATEQFAKLYNKHWDKDIICIRLGNVYGPRERWIEANKYKVFHNSQFNYQKIIPSFIVDTLNNRPVTIYGCGNQKSEYIYVQDIVNIVIKALESEKDLSEDIIETGTNQSYSVLEILNTLEKVWNKDIKKNFMPMRPGEKENTSIILDSKKLEDLLNYKIQYNLEKGLKKTIPYYEKILLNS